MYGLLNLIIVFVIIGVLLGLINRFIPMPGFIKTLINLVVAVVLILYVLQYFEVIFHIFPTIEVFHPKAAA